MLLKHIRKTNKSTYGGAEVKHNRILKIKHLDLFNNCPPPFGT